MSATRYKLLGFAVWQVGKWYLRRRLPSRRALALTAAGGLSALAAAGVLARRAAG
jgi:hypothetical protein